LQELKLGWITISMMQNTCPVCGLPQELCVCSEVEKTSAIIAIKIEKRKYGKLWAIITGIEVSNTDLKEIIKSIKSKLACGGTIKGKSVEVLYGKTDRTADLIKVLVEQGFNKDSIHVTSNK